MAAPIRKRLLMLTCIFYFCTPSVISAWDTDDLELFDTVEEVGRNFYEVLGIEQVQSYKMLKSLFRILLN